MEERGHISHRAEEYRIMKERIIGAFMDNRADALTSLVEKLREEEKYIKLDDITIKIKEENNKYRAYANINLTIEGYIRQLREAALEGRFPPNYKPTPQEEEEMLKKIEEEGRGLLLIDNYNNK